MAIAKHLLENYKKISFEETHSFKQNTGLKTFVNGNPIECNIYNKKYEIFNQSINVYNFKLDIRNFTKGDKFSFKFKNNLSFTFYDSDENTFMYIAEDEKNYYVFIGYDTDYNWGDSSFINDNYSYAFTGDIDNSCFEYMIIDNPNNYLKCEVDYNINAWFLKLYKTDFNGIDKDKLFDDISIELL